MKNNALTIQLDSLKESCCNAMKYNTSCLSYNLKLLSALADAVYIRDYLSELFDKWKKELPFIGDRDFINCDWSKEENSIRELVSEVQENLKDYYCQTTKFDLPSLNTPSEVKPRNYSNLVLGELYGNILPDDWDKMLKEKFPISDETVGWAVAKELYSEVSVDNNDVNRAAIKIIQKAIPFIGHSQYLDCMDCKLVEVLDDIANSLRKIYQLLTQPHTIIKDKYQLEDAFTTFFKRVYMEYAYDCGGYRECCNELDAFRNAYIGKKRWGNEYNLDLRPWLEREKYQEFICSGFMEPYVRNHGLQQNDMGYSEFCEKFPAPIYGGKGYASKGYAFLDSDDSKWKLHNEVGSYIYYNQLREKDWATKTKALLHLFLLIDLHNSEEYCNGVSPDSLKEVVSNVVEQRGLTSLLLKCLVQLSDLIEQKQLVDGKKWQKGDWFYVYLICEENELVKKGKTNFSNALKKIIKSNKGINLSQCSANSNRAENRERESEIKEEIKKILSPVIMKMQK